MYYRYEVVSNICPKYPHTGIIGFFDLLDYHNPTAADNHFCEFSNAIWNFNGRSDYPELPSPDNVFKYDIKSNAFCFFTEEGNQVYSSIIDQLKSVYQAINDEEGVQVKVICIHMDENCKYKLLYKDTYQAVFEMTNQDLDMVISSQA